MLSLSDCLFWRFQLINVLGLCLHSAFTSQFVSALFTCLELLQSSHKTLIFLLVSLRTTLPGEEKVALGLIKKVSSGLPRGVCTQINKQDEREGEEKTPRKNFSTERRQNIRKNKNKRKKLSGKKHFSNAFSAPLAPLLRSMFTSVMLNVE